MQPTWLETQSVPRSVSGNVHALDFGALVARVRRRHPQKPLAGAVGGNLLGDDVRPGKIVALLQFFEQRP